MTHHLPALGAGRSSTDDRSPRLHSVLLASLTTLLLAACGGGGGGEQAQVPPALASAPTWGDEGAALPAGAERVTPEALAAIVASRQVTWLGAEWQAALDAEQRRQTTGHTEDLALLRQADPALAARLEAPFVPAAGREQLPDGNVRVTLALPDGDTQVMVHDKRWLVAEAADALRSARSRDDAQARYRSLRDLLAADQLDGLPAPDALGGATADDINVLAQTAAARVSEFIVPQSAPDPSASVASGAADRKQSLAARRLASSLASGCNWHSDSISPYLDADFPLRPYLGQIRSQGRRGSCLAFAVAAALETRAYQQSGRKLDLSEQQLYAQYKGVWAPTPNAVGDGAKSSIMLPRLVATQMPVHTEGEWTYNRSSERIDLATHYLQSCKGYDQACSETNHQMKASCASAAGKTWCVFHGQVSVSAPESSAVRLGAYTSLNAGSPAATTLLMRAMVTAGRPVVFGMPVGGCTDFGSVWSEYPAGTWNDLPLRAFYSVDRCASADAGADLTGHAMTAVGFVTDAEMASRYGAGTVPAEGGWFIVRNSWGCGWGDGGYAYFSVAYLNSMITGAHSVDLVSAVGPTITLTADKSQLTTAGNVQLQAATNALARRVVFYRTSALGDLESLGEDTSAPFTRSVPFTAADNGENRFFAQAFDAAGNRVSSSVIKVTGKIPGAPLIDLAATPTALAPPASARLVATVADDGPIAKVEFYRGLGKLGERTSAPWEWTLDFGTSDAGSPAYRARVWDTQGNARWSDFVNVALAPPMKPGIETLTLTPGDLPLGGGTVQVKWQLKPGHYKLVHSLRLEPGDIDVLPLTSSNGSGQATLTVTETTQVTLTAANPGGSSTASKVVHVAWVPQIQSFTALPTIVAPGGGPVTLAWAVDKPASSTLRLDPGNIDVTGKASHTLTVAADTTFTLTATSPAGHEATRSVSVSVASTDTTPPTVSLAASTLQVNTPQTLTLTATASDNVGVAKVEFLRGATKVGEDTSAPFTFDVALTAADNGTASFTARAFDAAGNGASSSVSVSIAIPAPDTTPPTVSLTANPTAVAAPGSTTLTANATDDIGIAKVEFYESASKIGEATAAPYTFTRHYAAHESGSFSYVAVAIDTSGNAAGSVARLVDVVAAASADRYVSLGGSDAHPGTQAQPYLTLTKALAQVGSGGTVWVAPGTYPWANEVAAGAPAANFRTVTVPAGATVRASTPGATTLNFGLRAAGSVTAIGLHLTTVDGDTAHGYGSAFVLPNAGAVTLKGVSFGRWLQSFAYCNGCGGATLLLDDNGSAGFNYIGSDFAGSFLVLPSGTATISGGRLAGATLASTGQTCNSGMLMAVNGSAQVTLQNVAVALGAVSGGAANHPVGFCVAGTLNLVNSSVTQLGASARYRMVAVIGGRLSVQGSSLSGPTSAKIGTTSDAAQVTLVGSTLSGGHEGIVNNAGEYSEPTVTLTDTVMHGFAANAIHLPHGGSLSVTGGQIVDNGSAGIRLGGVASPGFYSGVYTLALRGATLSGNGGSAADGGGLVLAGAAGSSFDLGTAAQPGGSTLLGASASKPALRVAVDAAVTVDAVGNTWTPNQQGASASGTYGGTLVVSSGSGINYVRTSGSLRLSGP